MSDLPGITGITGFVDSNPEATPEQMHGGPADPRHGNWGEVAEPYSWESQLTGFTGPHGPYDNAYSTDDNVPIFSAGNISQDPRGDFNPSVGQVGGSHAAPITRPLSGPLPSDYEAITRQTIDSADQHASNLGASSKMQLSRPGLSVQQDDWSEDWAVTPGASLQATDVPPQLKGGVMFGTRSREQSFARQNEYGFDSPHLHRRAANGPIPGNYMWMQPGSRPLHKSIPGTSRPAVGADSPFYQDDPMQTFGTVGAVLYNTPGEYVAPPEPNLAPQTLSSDPAPEIQMW